MFPSQKVIEYGRVHSVNHKEIYTACSLMMIASFSHSTYRGRVFEVNETMLLNIGEALENHLNSFLASFYLKTIVKLICCKNMCNTKSFKDVC